MRVQMLAAAVLALAILNGDAVVVGADAPPSPTRRPPRGGPAIARGEQAPARRDARQRSLLDQLDDARINLDLQEMEVVADKTQIQKMMNALRETEFTLVEFPLIEGLPVEPFPRYDDSAQRGTSEALNPPVLPRPFPGNVDPAQRAPSLETSKHKLDRLCAEFVIRSKELSRLRRQVAELEAELGLTAAAASAAPAATPAPASAARSLAEAERLLDLVLRGVETWQRANPPAPDERSSPPRAPSLTPEDRPMQDAERLLDLLRRGIDAWQHDPSLPPEERVMPEQRPGPKREPDPDLLKDAERLLDLLRRGVETWQGR